MVLFWGFTTHLQQLNSVYASHSPAVWGFTTIEVSLFKPLPSGNLTWLLKMAIEIVSFPIKNDHFNSFL